MSKIWKEPRRAWKRTTQAWRKGIHARMPPWAKRTFGPTMRYVDMLLVDHGILRLVYLNRHRIDDRASRSAQPAPHQIRKFASEGVRTIVNLRGVQDTGSYLLERDACQRYGIALVEFQVRSRAAPTREEIRGAIALFDRIEYPMLMHCKSGADRAGLMSVLYAHVKQGLPMKEAIKHLSLRFGHIRQADTGVLDHFFESYMTYAEKHPISFIDWVETVYDPRVLVETLKVNSFANRIVNTVLRRE